jgi:hypothetical protein
MECHPSFKVLCSSRPEIPIESRICNSPSFRIQDHNSEDIKNFISSFDEAFWNLHPGDAAIKDSHSLVEELVLRAEGVLHLGKNGCC